MKSLRISEQEFNQIDSTRQIIAEEYARQFAALELGDTVYGLAWNSGELIHPEVVLSPDGQAAWVGVNQYLVAIEVGIGHVRVSMELPSNILEIIAVERLVAVRADLAPCFVTPQRPCPLPLLRFVRHRKRNNDEEW